MERMGPTRTMEAMKVRSSLDARIVGLWLLLLVILFPLLAYLSTHPGIVLRLEASQPSEAYGRGLQLLQQGRRAEAFAEFEKGRDFFMRLYEESRSENHKKQAVLCALAIANALTESGNPSDLNRALAYFAESIRLAPDISEGQPYLGEGNAYRRLGRYQEAVDAYAEATRRGNALLILDLLYWRGFSFLQLEKPDEAADDWYEYLRFTEKNIAPEQWVEFSRIPKCRNPRCHFILGYAALSLQNVEAARKHLETYLQSIPDDRCAKYLLSSLTFSPVPSDLETISLAECFPPGGSEPRPLNVTLLDLYVPRSGGYQLTAGLSGEATGTVLPKIAWVLNGMPVQELLLVSSQVKEYMVPVEMRAGKNRLRLEVKKSRTGEAAAKVTLHSLHLSQ